MSKRTLRCVEVLFHVYQPVGTLALSEEYEHNLCRLSMLSSDSQLLELINSSKLAIKDGSSALTELNRANEDLVGILDPFLAELFCRVGRGLSLVSTQLVDRCFQDLAMGTTLFECRSFTENSEEGSSNTVLCSDVLILKDFT